MGRISTLVVAVLLFACEPPRGESPEPADPLGRSAHLATVSGRALAGAPWSCEFGTGELIADGGLTRWPIGAGSFKVMLERGTHTLQVVALGSWSPQVSVDVRGGQQLDLGDLVVPIALGEITGLARIERATPQPSVAVAFHGPCSGTVQSDSAGRYTIPSLVPGLYDLSLQAMASTTSDAMQTSTPALVSAGHTHQARDLSVTGLGMVFGKFTIGGKVPGMTVVWVRAEDGSNGYAHAGTDGRYFLRSFAGTVDIRYGRGEIEEGALTVEVPFGAVAVPPSLDLPP